MRWPGVQACRRAGVLACCQLSASSQFTSRTRSAVLAVHCGLAAWQPGIVLDGTLSQRQADSTSLLFKVFGLHPRPPAARPVRTHGVSHMLDRNQAMALDSNRVCVSLCFAAF